MNDVKMKAPPVNMRQIMTQMVSSRCMSVAAELGIADLVANAPKSIRDLSKDLNADENALFRLIRVLSVQGIFSINEDRMVSNTPISEFLMEDVPGSQRNFARMMGSPWMWKVFNNLEHSVKTGEAAFGEAFMGSENLFEYFRNISPQDGYVFSQAMSGFSYSFDKPLVDAYDFSDVKHLVDLGGAEGRLLKTVKASYPDVRATLFELPNVIPRAKASDERGELNYAGGDFFQEIETVADCYTIKYVLHNWNDESSLKILQNLRKVIKQDGKLLIMDMLIKEDEQQVFEKSLDIVMLLLLGAKERTKEEFENLLSQSNFKINRIIPTKCPLSIIEVVPV
ncbi:MAG: methyltransferase [Cyclobacteriaceae bacterium]